MLPESVSAESGTVESGSVVSGLFGVVDDSTTMPVLSHPANVSKSAAKQFELVLPLMSDDSIHSISSFSGYR